MYIYLILDMQGLSSHPQTYQTAGALESSLGGKTRITVCHRHNAGLSHNV